MKLIFGLLFLIVFTMLGYSSRQAFTIKANSQNYSNADLMSSSKSDSNINIGRNISSIFQDSKGNMWFGTEGNGVYKFDGKTYTHITSKDGLVGNYVRTINQDKNGNIWFGTNEGISSYNGIFFIDFTKEMGSSYKLGYTSFKDHKGDLWFGTHAGVYKFNNSKLEYLELPISTTEKEGDISEYSVYSIVENGNGTLFFGTQHKGLYEYKGNTFTNISNLEIHKSSIRCLYKDNKGLIWIGNNGKGLYQLKDRLLRNLTDENHLVKVISTANNQTKYVGLASIWSITEDIAGNLWIGTIDDGLWRYDGKNFSNFLQKDGLQNEGVLSVYKDNSGKLWIGQLSGGISTFDGSKFEVVVKADSREGC